MKTRKEVLNYIDKKLKNIREQIDLYKRISNNFDITQKESIFKNEMICKIKLKNEFE